MNNKYSIIAIMVCVLSLMTSCLKDNDDTAIYYDDAAITSFKVGNLKRLVHTKTKAGKDTSYVATLDCSKYIFRIDQETGIIENSDSLPKGVDVSKALVTIATYNSSVAVYKSLTSDSVYFYQSTDSIDFTQPRTLICYSNDGSWNRTYKAQINVHKETTDSMYWNRRNTSSAIASLSGMKAFCHKGRMYVYGYDGNTPKLFATSVKDGNNWAQISAPFAGTLSVATDGMYIYALSNGGMIYTSADGDTWTDNASATDIKQLVAASRSEIYALGNDGMLMASKDKGVTWTRENIDSDASLLPTRDVCGVTIVSDINQEMDKVVIVGNRDVTSDSTAVVWSKTVDNNNTSKSGEWMHQKFDSENIHKAPCVSPATVTTYKEGIVMLGGNGINSCREKALKKFYASPNAGLHWWDSGILTMPEGFSSSDTSFAIATDDEKQIWIFCGGTGQVWVGYYSTYHWSK